ncbi:MAG TPA: dTDP-glucose 4,6-dehydratase [Actinomycetota bacterium]|nr:dTDP-glucose 4,6-dehydratase [Actinomycetota bacterium]
MVANHVLVTGGAGFIGSHLVDALLAHPSKRVTVLDRLSSGGSRANLEHHDGDPRLTFVSGDLNHVDLVREVVGGVDAVIHAAAESHVDRSIDEARGFLESNLMGTQSVLQAVRATGNRLLMISTDEVYGPGDAGGGLFAEDAPIAPRSPYAASKAAADLLCQAYRTTYGVDVTVVRGTNAYGPRQIERVVPTYTICALEQLPVPVYGTGEQRREFLHVHDWVRAALTVLERGTPGVTYNIGAGTELSNFELAERIVELVGVSNDMIAFVPDRPGHDFRYGVASDRVRALGWEPAIGFDEGLAATVAWYREHREWLYRAHEIDVVTRPRPPQGVS